MPSTWALYRAYRTKGTGSGAAKFEIKKKWQQLQWRMLRDDDCSGLQSSSPAMRDVRGGNNHEIRVHLEPCKCLQHDSCSYVKLIVTWCSHVQHRCIRIFLFRCCYQRPGGYCFWRRQCARQQQRCQQKHHHRWHHLVSVHGHGLHL